REGKLGVMDYYNMHNVMADTKMREAIGGVSADNKRASHTEEQQDDN
ncbi:MAG: flotillin-like FloA family protein, partial [Selenomonadales bacterium]|nr:flotillin-like FloA family protein [Selenomonadales bacterium]